MSGQENSTNKTIININNNSQMKAYLHQTSVFKQTNEQSMSQSHSFICHIENKENTSHSYSHESNSPTKSSASYSSDQTLRHHNSDSDSHDSGFAEKGMSDVMMMMSPNKDRTDESQHTFVQPSGIAPRSRSRIWSPNGSPISNNSMKNECSTESVASSMCVENDDDFMGEIFMDRESDDTLMPYGLSSLMSAPLELQSSNTHSYSKYFKARNETPKNAQKEEGFRKGKSIRRALSLQTNLETPPSSSHGNQWLNNVSSTSSPMDHDSPVFSFGGSSMASRENIEKNISSSLFNRRPFKRLESEYDSPMNFNSGNTSNKIRKSSSFMSDSNSCTPKSAHALKRCWSENEATIMNAVTRSTQDPSLIGDYSRPYALPLIQGKHKDLKSISGDILAQVMTGVYNDLIDTCTIVDCRYPYEYNGGHIKTAKNLYRKHEIMNEFLEFNAKPSLNSSAQDENIKPNKRHILVFHCEFSSERGPSLLRYLRNEDRARNLDNYPSLNHPEVYILDGGYKAFYEKHKDLCVPQTYLPMHAKDHEDELKFYRAQTKDFRSNSWTGETAGKSRSSASDREQH